MPKMLKIHKGISDGILHVLHNLLEEKKVRAVLTLMQDESGTVSYSLISDPEKLEKAVPLYPVMPNNAGKLLSTLTLKEPFKKPVAAVIRPCELRAFVELVKRMQGSPENLVIISSVCSGVFPLDNYVQGEVDKQLNNYRAAVFKGEPVSGIRETCRSCEQFIPTGADIIVATAGESNGDNECKLFLNTEKGAELLDDIQGDQETAELETDNIKTIRSRRHKEREKLFKELQETLSRPDGLTDFFDSCISCHGCSAICPICYCRLCEFDSQRNEYKPENFETELNKRGGVRVPPGTLAFHIGRLTHMGISCVGCGMCSDVCPADIPVASIFTKAGESVQKMFDYLPGRDIEEDLPFTTFEEQELTEVED